MTSKVLIPVLTDADLDDAVSTLCTEPLSTASTRGPDWMRADRARRVLTDAAVAFTVRSEAAPGSAVGVLIADRMQTPGHLRIDLWSADDAEIRRCGLARALDEAARFLCFGVEVSRIDLVFGVYNDVVLQAVLDTPGFRCEGEMRDRFFAAGRYWNGLVFSVTGDDLDRFRCGSGELSEHHRRIAARVRHRIRADLDRSAES